MHSSSDRLNDIKLVKQIQHATGQHQMHCVRIWISDWRLQIKGMRVHFARVNKYVRDWDAEVVMNERHWMISKRERKKNVWKTQTVTSVIHIRASYRLKLVLCLGPCVQQLERIILIIMMHIYCTHLYLCDFFDDFCYSLKCCGTFSLMCITNISTKTLDSSW